MTGPDSDALFEDEVVLARAPLSLFIAKPKMKSSTTPLGLFASQGKRQREPRDNQDEGDDHESSSSIDVLGLLREDKKSVSVSVSVSQSISTESKPQHQEQQQQDSNTTLSTIAETVGSSADFSQLFASRISNGSTSTYEYTGTGSSPVGLLMSASGSLASATETITAPPAPIQDSIPSATHTHEEAAIICRRRTCVIEDSELELVEIPETSLVQHISPEERLWSSYNSIYESGDDDEFFGFSDGKYQDVLLQGSSRNVPFRPEARQTTSAGLLFTTPMSKLQQFLHAPTDPTESSASTDLSEDEQEQCPLHVKDERQNPPNILDKLDKKKFEVGKMAQSPLRTGWTVDNASPRMDRIRSPRRRDMAFVKHQHLDVGRKRGPSPLQPSVPSTPLHGCERLRLSTLSQQLAADTEEDNQIALFYESPSVSSTLEDIHQVTDNSSVDPSEKTVRTSNRMSPGRRRARPPNPSLEDHPVSPTTKISLIISRDAPIPMPPPFINSSTVCPVSPNPPPPAARRSMTPSPGRYGRNKVQRASFGKYFPASCPTSPVSKTQAEQPKKHNKHVEFLDLSAHGATQPTNIDLPLTAPKRSTSNLGKAPTPIRDSESSGKERNISNKKQAINRELGMSSLKSKTVKAKKTRVEAGKASASTTGATKGPVAALKNNGTKVVAPRVDTNRRSTAAPQAKREMSAPMEWKETTRSFQNDGTRGRGQPNHGTIMLPKERKTTATDRSQYMWTVHCTTDTAPATYPGKRRESIMTVKERRRYVVVLGETKMEVEESSYLARRDGRQGKPQLQAPGALQAKLLRETHPASGGALSSSISLHSFDKRGAVSNDCSSVASTPILSKQREPVMSVKQTRNSIIGLSHAKLEIRDDNYLVKRQQRHAFRAQQAPGALQAKLLRDARPASLGRFSVHLHPFESRGAMSPTSSIEDKSPRSPMRTKSFSVSRNKSNPSQTKSRTDPSLKAPPLLQGRRSRSVDRMPMSPLGKRSFPSSGSPMGHNNTIRNDNLRNPATSDLELHNSGSSNDSSLNLMSWKPPIPQSPTSRGSVSTHSSIHTIHTSSSHTAQMHLEPHQQSLVNQNVRTLPSSEKAGASKLEKHGSVSSASRISGLPPSGRSVGSGSYSASSGSSQSETTSAVTESVLELLYVPPSSEKENRRSRSPSKRSSARSNRRERSSSRSKEASGRAKKVNVRSPERPRPRSKTRDEYKSPSRSSQSRNTEESRPITSSFGVSAEY